MASVEVNEIPKSMILNSQIHSLGTGTHKIEVNHYHTH